MKVSGVRRTASALLAACVATVGLLAVGISPAAAAPLAYTTVFTDGGCQIVTVDIANGTTTVLSAAPDPAACVRDLAVAPDGSLWGIDEVEDSGGPEVTLVQFDPATGAILDSGLLTGTFDFSSLESGGIAFDAAGTLYVHMVTDQFGCFGAFVCLYRVDPATRASTFVGPSFQPEIPMFFLTANCAGAMLTSQFNGLVTSVPSSGIEHPDVDTSAPPEWPDVSAQNSLFEQVLSSVNTSNGIVIPSIVLPPNFDVLGIEYDRVSGILYAIGLEESPNATTPDDVGVAQPFNDIAVFVVDPTTGDITLAANFNDKAGFPQGLAIGGECEEEAPLVVSFTG